MNRRKFIKGAAVAGGATAVAASTFPAPAIAQKRIEINMVSTWPRDFPGLGTGAQRFAKNLEAMTDGFQVFCKALCACSQSREIPGPS